MMEAGPSKRESQEVRRITEEDAAKDEQEHRQRRRSEEARVREKELQRQFLSRKISEVLFEIDQMNIESGINLQFDASSLLADDRAILDKYRRLLHEAREFKMVVREAKLAKEQRQS
jgi:hypothetical protein